jgi:hypothetical protein
VNTASLLSVVLTVAVACDANRRTPICGIGSFDPVSAGALDTSSIRQERVSAARLR